MNIRIIAPAALCLLALGCTETPQPAPAAQTEPAAVEQTGAETPPADPPAESAIDKGGPVDLDANVDAPAGFETAGVETGDCMTPVDMFNDAPVVPGPYPAGGDLAVAGWNITASKDAPVPGDIFGVFKPYDGAQKGALLTGERVARPDLAKQNAAYEMAGFRLVGKFPASPGKYRFYIWTGTKDALTECDSNIVVQIQ